MLLLGDTGKRPRLQEAHAVGLVPLPCPHLHSTLRVFTGILRLAMLVSLLHALFAHSTPTAAGCWQPATLLHLLPGVPQPKPAPTRPAVHLRLAQLPQREVPTLVAATDGSTAFLLLAPGFWTMPEVQPLVRKKAGGGAGFSEHQPGRALLASSQAV